MGFNEWKAEDYYSGGLFCLRRLQHGGSRREMIGVPADSFALLAKISFSSSDDSVS